MERLSKHDAYVMDLKEMIGPAYDKIIIDYSIKDHKKTLAQADLYGICGDRVDIYEVKCSYRIHKAAKQLARLQHLMHAHGRLFFYCGSSGELKEIEAKGV